MPAISATDSPIILVTGANGYIALWVIQLLLDRGYTIRGQVRSASKLTGLDAIFDKEKYKERLEWIVVPDIVQEGAFDEAIKGVSGVVHTASPLPEGTHGDQKKPFYEPVVNGTLSILKSASKYGDKVKRIVITSTIGAAMHPVPKVTDGQPTVICTEKDWGDAFVEIHAQLGDAAPALLKYCAAKVLAERAVADFVESKKGEIGWDVSTILPALSIGPALSPAKTPEQLGFSLWKWRNAIFEDSSDETLGDAHSVVDVRDAALAHVLALEVEEAAGERFLISSTIDTYQGIRNQIRVIDPTVDTPLGNPDAKKTILIDADNTKSKNILGLEYIDGTTSIKDTLEYFKEMGEGLIRLK